MGVAELRDAFNAVSQPRATCTSALMNYSRDAGGEWQILTFHGTDDAGAAFEVRSDLIKGDRDLNVVAKEVAQRLLDQRKPAP